MFEGWLKLCDERPVNTPIAPAGDRGKHKTATDAGNKPARSRHSGIMGGSKAGAAPGYGNEGVGEHVRTRSHLKAFATRELADAS